MMMLMICAFECVLYLCAPLHPSTLRCILCAYSCGQMGCWLASFWVGWYRCMSKRLRFRLVYDSSYINAVMLCGMMAAACHTEIARKINYSHLSGAQHRPVFFCQLLLRADCVIVRYLLVDYFCVYSLEYRVSSSFIVPCLTNCITFSYQNKHFFI